METSDQISPTVESHWRSADIGENGRSVFPYGRQVGKQRRLAAYAPRETVRDLGKRLGRMDVRYPDRRNLIEAITEKIAERPIGEREFQGLDIDHRDPVDVGFQHRLQPNLGISQRLLGSPAIGYIPGKAKEPPR